MAQIKISELTTLAQQLQSADYVPVVHNAATYKYSLYNYFVKNSGDETIAGVKTFSSTPIMTIQGGSASSVIDTIQLRSDTAANWTSTNPVLAVNEKGRESDTGKGKTGDGTTAWNSLGYDSAFLSSTPSAGKVMVWPDSVAIVESGSNAYGSWIKFCDGTMILRGKITTVVGTNTYTLPQSPYNSSDADGGSSTSHSYVPVAGVDGTNLAWHENRTLKVVATVANNYITWTIICRWKA